MRPLSHRPLDICLLAFFSISVLYGLLFNIAEGLGVPVAPDSPWPPLQWLHAWAVAEEPAHLNPPPNLMAAIWFDAFFATPALMFIMYGLVRQRSWVKNLALIYAGAAVTNMFFYFTQTFLGDDPPPNTTYYLIFNLPWMIVPMILACRVLLGKDLIFDRPLDQ